MQAATVLRLTRRVLRGAVGFAATTSTRLTAYALVALFAMWPVLSRAGAVNEFRDAQFLRVYEEGAVRSLRAGQLPLWNPYYCGGLYAWGTPQSRHASPAVLLSWLLGAARAEAFLAFLLVLLGMEGFYRYARRPGVVAAGPFVAAPMFALCGFFASSYFNGWLSFFGFQLVPWVLYGARLTAVGDRRGFATVALSFATIVGFGGTYAAPMAALFAVPEYLRGAVGHLYRAKDHRALALRDVCLRAALVAWLAATVAAFRLWPVLETLASAPRVMAGAPKHTLDELTSMLRERGGVLNGDLIAAGFAFVGVAPRLVATGLASGLRALAPLLFGAFALAAARGYDLPDGPFVSLRDLPFLSTFRYPERFLLFAVLYGAELGALGVHAMAKAAMRRRTLITLGGTVLATAIALGLALGARAEARNLKAMVSQVWFEAPPPAETLPFHQARGNRWLAAHYVAQNVGSIGCFEAYPVPMSTRLRGDLPQEEYLDDASAGTVRRVGWSPGRIDLDVRLTRPTRVLVNQNWHPGWRASVGRVRSVEGLLAVELPAGEHRVTLRFLPRSALGGIAISLAACAALVVLARRRRRREVLLALSAPALVGALAYVLFAEPPMPPPLLRNPNGAPLVVDALPSGVRPLAVTFETPVELRGVRLPTERGEYERVDFELYWRVTGEVPRAVSMFVHVISPSGELINLDHEALGGSVFFSNAPRGLLLRDVFSATLEGRPEGRYYVFVGLWRSSGDEGRIPVVDRAWLPYGSDGLLVGSFEHRR